jgi:2-methylisocitrate lyase-like PEP mutase family enzyme
MSQIDKAKAFASLHRRDDPLVLYNIWDAGGAKTIAKAGAPAVATGSWSMAAAHGFEDGEAIPLDLVLSIVARICASVEVPVTVDFEGGYAAAPDAVAGHAKRLLQAGVVGLNFEDRIVGGEGLYSTLDQSARIAAIRGMADAEGIPLFINARTDLFLGSGPGTHTSLVLEAMKRLAAYAEAGADGFFVPGLMDLEILRGITSAAGLPVNAMKLGALSSVGELRGCGISRFSHGPAPFLDAVSDLEARFQAA